MHQTSVLVGVVGTGFLNALFLRPCASAIHLVPFGVAENVGGNGRHLARAFPGTRRYFRVSGDAKSVVFPAHAVPRDGDGLTAAAKARQLLQRAREDPDGFWDEGEDGSAWIQSFDFFMGLDTRVDIAAVRKVLEQESRAALCDGGDQD